MSKKLLLFDFDGTLTFKDSFLVFLKFRAGFVRFYLGMLWLSPLLIRYKLGFISNAVAKQKVVQFFLKGKSELSLRKTANDFSLKIIPQLIRPQALKSLEKFINQKHEICVVSASLSFYLEPWCKQMNINCIATQMEFKNGIFTAKYVSPNCYGQEKLNRILQHYAKEDFDEIWAFGDTKGDAEMLAWADRKCYKPFRKNINTELDE